MSWKAAIARHCGGLIGWGRQEPNGGEAAAMIEPPDSTQGGTRKTRRFAVGDFFLRFGKIMFVAVLVVLFFLLAQDMVRHRFFQGSRNRANGTVGQ
jgi:hypothetical protein